MTDYLPESENPTEFEGEDLARVATEWTEGVGPPAILRGLTVEQGIAPLACPNCGAAMVFGKAGTTDNRWFCCVDCAFNPDGCRCHETSSGERP